MDFSKIDMRNHSVFAFSQAAGLKVISKFSNISMTSDKNVYFYNVYLEWDLGALEEVLDRNCGEWRESKVHLFHNPVEDVQVVKELEKTVWGQCF